MRYPGAAWRPLGPQNQPRMRGHDIVCLHTMVGSLWGTDAYFRQGGYGGTESHFGVGAGGGVLQWQDCVAADTLVLCDDLTWRPARSLAPGDGIVGIDESAPRKHRRLRRAVVTANGIRTDDLYEVRTGRGVLRCNGKHPWLARTQRRAAGGGRGTWKWVRTDELHPGDDLYHVVDPWGVDPSWEAGWLAGFLDGEGCLSFSGNSVVLSCSQRVSGLADEMARVFKEYADNIFVFGRDYDGTRKPMVQVQVNRRDQIMRLLGAVRPHRLLARSSGVWEGAATMKMVTPVQVESVEPCGHGEISLLGTSTGTYIAQGFAAHNTDFVAEANLNGNWHLISIETADVGLGFPAWNTNSANVPAWTVAQVESIAKLVAWCCLTYDIPCAVIPDSRPGRRGVGWHRQGIDPYRVSGGETWSNARGKVCPGDRRVAQIPQVVARANEIMQGAGQPPPAPVPDNQEDEMFVAMGDDDKNLMPDRVGLLSGGIFKELPGGYSSVVRDAVERQKAPMLWVVQETWDWWVMATEKQLGYH